VDEKVGKISALLHEASETHHVVYRIVDGDDPDWASWYADWLMDHSELTLILGKAPVRSHLVYALVKHDRDFTGQKMSGKWEDYYARKILEEFSK
jgi:hypothetical protein